MGKATMEWRVSEGSDRELARRAAAGEAEAFARLLDRHYDRIHRLAWRLTGSRTDAEDVAQEVCVKLATAVRTYRGDADVGTWIWRITYNAATDVFRARQRISTLEPSEMVTLVDGLARTSGPHAVMGGQYSSTSDGQGATSGDAIGEVWEAVNRLPGQQRDAVLLVYGEEMSHAQAAEVMGCSEKTVSWHLHTARRRLKTMLEPAA